MVKNYSITMKNAIKRVPKNGRMAFLIGIA
jgi:hypothetical protein